MKYNSYLHSKQTSETPLKNNINQIKSNNRYGHASLTQSQFTSKKNSFKNISNLSYAGGISDFCQTLSSGFGNEWLRPESKHASRRQACRPETSKGARNYAGYYIQPNFTPVEQSRLNGPLKSQLPSKSMYTCSQDLLETSKDKENYKEEYKEEKNDYEKVKIVVTRSEKPRKEKSFKKEKLETNLPDDFLYLFAD